MYVCFQHTQQIFATPYIFVLSSMTHVGAAQNYILTYRRKWQVDQIVGELLWENTILVGAVVGVERVFERFVFALGIGTPLARS